MIRLATPVIDGNGKTAGVLALNYLASELLSRINENTLSVSKPTISLLNSEGY